MERKQNTDPTHLHPLVDWGMAEKDCKEYCYQKGYDWGGLYEIFDRTSCWCCPLARLSELKKLYVHFPELWAQLEEWDKRMLEDSSKSVKYKGNYTVHDLAMRFQREIDREKYQTKLEFENEQYM